jgi:murein DD-endopeptidase MepM/ murein hydrolase activator NlpD
MLTAGILVLVSTSVARAGTDLALAFPQDPLLTYFSDSYGAPRPGGRHHQGIDLMAPKHSPVLAAGAGVVTIVSDGPRSGRYLVIEHAGDWSTWYMHLNNDDLGTDNGRADWSLTLAEGIEPGAEVRAGQLIGYVGDSGNAEGSGPHTHFELHLGGRAVNPFQDLAGAFEVALEAAAAQSLESRVSHLCAAPGAFEVDAELCPPLLGPVDQSMIPQPVMD